MAIVKKLSPITLGFLLLLVVWQAAIMIGGHQSALFPPPLKVGKHYWRSFPMVRCLHIYKLVYFDFSQAI